MAMSAARRLANEKYLKEKCDRIGVDVPKGKRDAYKLIAAELDISLASLIQVGVEEYARTHAGEKFVVPAEVTAKSVPEKKLTAAERKLVETFARLPEKTRAKFTGLLENVADLIDSNGGN